MESGFFPASRLKWSVTYYKVGAFYPFGRNLTVFGTGTDRGNNLQTRLDFKVNDHLRGHIDYETLLPGDFYAHSDAAYFLRFEMIADAAASIKKLKHRFGGDPAIDQGAVSK